MRWSIVVVCMLCACSQKKKQEPVGTGSDNSPPLTQVKREVSQRPLPGLASDTGGATGKPMWQVGFGGYGIDVPRGGAGAPAGSEAKALYLAGYFARQTHFGATH